MKLSTMASGRIAIKVPDHPASNGSGYILRARYVMEQHLGRPLRSDEHVHHKNGNKIDDRPENLELITAADHSKLHSVERRKLDYDLINLLRQQGYGAKKIAKLIDSPLSSIKSAIKVIKNEHKN